MNFMEEVICLGEGWMERREWKRGWGGKWVGWGERDGRGIRGWGEEGEVLKWGS